MQNHFTKNIDRTPFSTVKYDLRKVLFGTEDIIPLWVADMDLPTAPEITEALIKRLEHPIYGYTLQDNSFWQSAIDWIDKRHQWKVHRKDFVFVAGIVPALGFLVEAFTQPKEKVGIFSPVYPPFRDNIVGNDRTLVEIPFINTDNRYFIDFDLFEEELKNGLKLLIFCHPHNPSGRVWSKEELEKILQLCDQYDCNIISDEIHADLMFYGHKHIPFASLSDVAEKRVVTCMAPSKTFNLAGLNCAYLIFKNKELQDKYVNRVKHMHLDFGGLMATESMKAAYNQGENWYQDLLKHIQGNIDYIVEQFDKTPIKAMKPDATYLVWLDCRALGTQNQIKEFFFKKAKVGVQDGLMFGIAGDGFMRLNTAYPKSVLEEAMKRILNQLE
ncbi:PatB family C-S lyase [Flammeovirga yaeyamensis]|uniref:cysteine-S-conjugate beta-lyase n=1 Tax=Flammeovirga yaeyamensis TaxID=367791 RepID=A0AAX1MZN5_9BACT|nr:PatB family C-S lyase [Flammeovirga yaeyamensis]MBB3700933.1 cystathionine beta-lyase [Flammeovirga yaeyamensis]NMF38040.1 putative C-S lyase [Flammeovirga yaeyamensis]QWG00690.1 PatB family C-S lyase [Flammeovirga yaeyamensis]